MQTCHVRPATAGDAPVSIAVLRSSIEILCSEDHTNDPVILERWLRNKTESSFIGWLADSSKFVAVAELDTIIRGVGMIDTSGDLRLCYVEPGFQLRGIGRALLLALEQRAWQWGLAEVRLKSSVGAREFYERQGYASSGPPEQAFGVVASYPYTKDIRRPTGC